MSKPNGKQILNEIKDNVKNKNKEKNQVKKVIASTVVTTLIIMSALAGMFYLGVKYEQGINTRVQTEVKTLTAQLKTDVK